MMMKKSMKHRVVRQFHIFGSGRRSYYIDTSVGSLLENIEIVYNNKITHKKYPIISEKEFRSQQQLILSGLYELSPFQVQYLNDDGVSEFLVMRVCDLFGIAKNPFRFDKEEKSAMYMVSSIAARDELVLGGLALTIYRFTHYYSIDYDTWVEGLIMTHYEKVKAIDKSNRLYRLRVKFPLLGGSVSRCRVLEVLKVYVEEDSLTYNLVKQFLYNKFLNSDGEDFPLDYLPDLGEITFSLENLIMTEVFEKAFDQKFPGIQYYRFLNEVLINCTSIGDEIVFNERAGYDFLEEVYLPGDIVSIGPGDSAPLSLSSSFSLLVPAPISFPLSLLGEVLSALFYVSG